MHVSHNAFFVSNFKNIEPIARLYRFILFKEGSFNDG